MIRLCVEVSNGRVPVIAGSGTNDTRRTVELTREAARLGADGALVVTPYYSRPSQEGLFRHFESVAQSAELPIIIYNVLRGPPSISGSKRSIVLHTCQVLSASRTQAEIRRG